MRPISIKKALTWSKVLDAIYVEDEDLDRSKVAGTLIHLFPDESLSQFKYKWDSTYIQAIVSNWKEWRLLLQESTALNVDSFYGALFEPFFHDRVAENGYTGNIRRLKSVTDIRVTEAYLGTKSERLFQKSIWGKMRLLKLIYVFKRLLKGSRWQKMTCEEKAIGTFHPEGRAFL